MIGQDTLDVKKKRELLKPILNEIKAEEDETEANERYAKELLSASESRKIKKPHWKSLGFFHTLDEIFNGTAKKGLCPECSKELHHKRIPVHGGQTAITVYWCDCCYQWAKWTYL